MLHIVLWKWNQPSCRATYTSAHVNIMAAMIRRNTEKMKREVRIVLVSDNYADVDMAVDCHPLWKDFKDMPNASGAHFPSCYRRLKLFDPATQREMGIKPGDRIASFDLDTVIVNDMSDILSRKDRFVSWGVKGTRHPRVFNGSFFMFTAGDYEHIWKTFDPATSPKIVNRAGYFGSDQAWISYLLVQNPECYGISSPYILSYPRECPRHRILPMQTKIVFFHGRVKPWFQETVRNPWIGKNWRL